MKIVFLMIITSINDSKYVLQFPTIINEFFQFWEDNIVTATAISNVHYYVLQFMTFFNSQALQHHSWSIRQDKYWLYLWEVHQKYLFDIAHDMWWSWKILITFLWCNPNKKNLNQTKQSLIVEKHLWNC